MELLLKTHSFEGYQLGTDTVSTAESSSANHDKWQQWLTISQVCTPVWASATQTALMLAPTSGKCYDSFVS